MELILHMTTILDNVYGPIESNMHPKHLYTKLLSTMIEIWISTTRGLKLYQCGLFV